MNRATPLRRTAGLASGDFVDPGAVERQCPADFFAEHKPALVSVVRSCTILPPWVAKRWIETVERWDVRDFSDLDSLLRELVVEQRLVAVGHRPSTFDADGRAQFLAEMDNLKRTLQTVRNALTEAKSRHSLAM